MALAQSQLSERTQQQNSQGDGKARSRNHNYKGAFNDTFERDSETPRATLLSEKYEQTKGTGNSSEDKAQQLKGMTVRHQMLVQIKSGI